MTPVHISFSSLRKGRPYEYLVRFALGGAATVLTGLISSRYRASVGGLFLALPVIFCASATLIEKHEIRRKKEAGLNGRRRGQEAAALDAAWDVGLRACLLPSGQSERFRRLRRVVDRMASRLDDRLVRAA